MDLLGDSSIQSGIWTQLRTIDQFDFIRYQSESVPKNYLRDKGEFITRDRLLVIMTIVSVLPKGFIILLKIMRIL